MEPLQYMSFGSGIVAMKGKKCVAIAADRLYAEGSVRIEQNEKIYSFGSHLYVGIAGKPTNARSVQKVLRFRSNITELTQRKAMTPKRLTALLTNVLYTQRFQAYDVCSVVAGLAKDTWEPYICALDPIGCQQVDDKYVTAGSCKRQLLGCCEMMWRPNLSPDDLFETISQALMSSCDRDLLSGSGATVYVIEKEKVTIRTLKTRMD